MLPAVRDLDVPVVLVNVQKKKAPDYANTDIPTWLGELYACRCGRRDGSGSGRAGKRHAVITGVVEGGDPVVAAEINDWCKAAQVRRRFRAIRTSPKSAAHTPAMDLCIDDEPVQPYVLYTKQFDWEKMWAIADDITDEDVIRAKAQDILNTFDIEGGGTVEKVCRIWLSTWSPLSSGSRTRRSPLWPAIMTALPRARRACWIRC